MLKAGLVNSVDELEQIHRLNKLNLKQCLSVDQQKNQGFVTWLYSMDLLKQLHQLASSVIVKDGDKVAGYALTTLKESGNFHADLNAMFEKLKEVVYKGQQLTSFNFYCMGQICIDKQYRSMGIVNMLYQKHKQVYSHLYDFILTEISTSNYRSLKAHQKIGFQTI